MKAPKRAFGHKAAWVLAAGGMVLLVSGSAFSDPISHDTWRLEQIRGGTAPADAYGECENCHTLDPTRGQPETQFILSTIRTLPWMKPVPATFGCTFCHFTATTNVGMKDALEDYLGVPAGLKHPLGITVDPDGDGPGRGAPNTNLYFSGTTSAPLGDQLQCNECHDTALLTYPSHEAKTTDPAPWGGTWDVTVNPAALQNVTVAADAGGPHCLLTCHSDTQDTATKPAMGHYGWGGYDKDGRSRIYEPRGTAIKENRCFVCHDFHNSRVDNLMTDGTEVVPGTGAPEAALNEADCTAVCHAGDQPTDEFQTDGHGKYGASTFPPTGRLACAPCHTSLVSHRTPGNEKRFGKVEDTAFSTITNNGIGNRLDDDYDGLVDEADEAAWVQPSRSICGGLICHPDHESHSGTIAGVTGTAGCLDCHEVHGKGLDNTANVPPGSGRNIAMLRSVINGEFVTFETTPDDYYRADGNGACDNAGCHAGLEIGGNGTPGTILYSGPGGIPEHKGVVAGARCPDCHAHGTSDGPR